jgi:uncharacterized membrane protein YecN with MAPEG domain
MQAYPYTAIVTLLAALALFGMATQVARTHVKVGILPPQMTGHPLLEQAVRGHLNALEWMPIFLPSLWLFASYWNDKVAALLGVVWIVGRVMYFVGYAARPERRFPGFLVQTTAAGILLLGALGRIIYQVITGA